MPAAALSPSALPVPRHVAVIMDGNGRWAARRALAAARGHRAGIKAVRTIIEECVRHGVGALTLFAFSSENWQPAGRRGRRLMELFLESLDREVAELDANGVRIRFIGDCRRCARARCAHARGREPHRALHPHELTSPSAMAGAGISRRRRAVWREQCVRGRWSRGDRRDAHRAGAGASTGLIRICSSARAASSASAISCSGTSRTPSSSSPTRCGPTSTTRSSSWHSGILPGDSGVSA